MKIDLSQIPIPDPFEPGNQPGKSSPVQNLIQDALESFPDFSNLYDEILRVTQDVAGAIDLSSLVEGLQSEFQQKFQTAQIGASQPGSTSQALTSGKGKQVAGKKEKSEEFENLLGDNKDKSSITKKELRDINGIINWNKGKTLLGLDKEFHAWRFLEISNAGEGDFGKASLQIRGDFLSARGRVFTETGFDLKNFVAKIGIGAQVAVELAGIHVEAKHDAPNVTIAGHDAALHAIFNIDAFIGAIGEAEAMLSIGSDTFLKLGGEAFAGASAAISGALSLGNFGALTGTASAYAGIGGKAELDIDYNFKTGDFEFEHGLGAAFMVGAGYDIGFSVNVLELTGLAADIGKNWEKDIIGYPLELLGEAAHALASNLGSELQLVDYIFHISQDSEPLPGAPPQQDARQRLEEKKNRQPSEPLA